MISPVRFGEATQFQREVEMARIKREMARTEFINAAERKKRHLKILALYPLQYGTDG